MQMATSLDQEGGINLRLFVFFLRSRTTYAALNEKKNIYFFFPCPYLGQRVSESL